MNLETFTPLLHMVADAIGGKPPDPVEAARMLVGVGLELVPIEDLRQYLDEEAKRRQDLAFEVSKAVKFGPDG